VTPGERWLGVMWPLVRASLPLAAARVVEIGCGPLGGFVPMLRSSGYEAVGVDPEAPDEEHYCRIEFEHVELPQRVDAVVAFVSLHHVADPGDIVDRITRILASGGAMVVVEWGWENFDEPTARWCFQRLKRADAAGWLHRRRDDWAASGQEWDAYLRNWAQQEGLHSGQALLRLLDQHFDRQLLAHGPYFFADLPDTSEAHEQAAIDAGQIRANRIDYAGRLL
jgi:SAM-dependent methyltransferase